MKKEVVNIYDIINSDIENKVTEGDCVVIHETNWNYTKRIVNPYKAIVLWQGINRQPLITKYGEYKPYWSTYTNIVDIVGHVDLKNLFVKIYPNLLKEGD